MQRGTPGSSPEPPSSGARPAARALALLLLPLATAACEVEWGGASLELEEPSVADPAGAETGEPEPREDGSGEVAPLPRSPLLYLVRAGSDGRVEALPAARLGPDGLSPLGWPAAPDPRYRASFDSAFAAAGTSLAYHSGGDRTGTVILTGQRTAVNEACPSVSEGVLLVPPGTDPPATGVAVGPGAEGTPAPSGEVSLGRRGRLFGPILAERILRDAGYERAYLASQARLEAVAFPGDTVPGIAATYLVNDSLRAAPPPAGPSASLFYLARYESARGYVPVWSAIRQYRGAEEKEVYTHVDWIRVPGGRLHLLRRHDAGSVRLSAVRIPDEEGAEPELWHAEGGCPSFEVLGE